MNPIGSPSCIFWQFSSELADWLDSRIEELKKLVGENKSKIVLNRLSEVLRKDSEEYDEVMILYSRIRRIETDENAGIISRIEYAEQAARFSFPHFLLLCLDFVVI